MTRELFAAPPERHIPDYRPNKNDNRRTDPVRRQPVHGGRPITVHLDIIGTTDTNHERFFWEVSLIIGELLTFPWVMSGLGAAAVGRRR